MAGSRAAGLGEGGAAGRVGTRPSGGTSRTRRRSGPRGGRRRPPAPGRRRPRRAASGRGAWRPRPPAPGAGARSPPGSLRRRSRRSPPPAPRGRPASARGRASARMARPSSSSRATSCPAANFFLNLVPPGGPAVGEGLDGVDVAGVVGQEDFARPAVVVDQPHLRFLPVVVTCAPVLHDGGDLVVPILEDVGGDLEDVARDPLHRVAASVDLRLHALDDDAAGRVEDIWQWHCRCRLELRGGHRSSSPEFARAVSSRAEFTTRRPL